MGAVPFRGFPREVTQGSHQAASIPWRNAPFVNKNYPAVISLFFRPRFEERGNRPSIVGNERPPLRGSLFETGGVFLTQEFSAFPFRHTRNYQQPMATAKTIGNRRRDMLVQKKLEHLSSLVIF